jgi:hypothetical protein
MLRRPPDQEAAGVWSLSGRIADIVSRYDWVVTQAIPTLTRGEWMVFAHANSNAASLDWLDGGNLYWGLAWANVADSPELGEKWGVDLRTLIDRLRSMTLAEQLAMFEVLERFWGCVRMDPDAALAEAGARVAPDRGEDGGTP